MPRSRCTEGGGIESGRRMAFALNNGSRGLSVRLCGRFRGGGHSGRLHRGGIGRWSGEESDIGYDRIGIEVTGLLPTDLLQLWLGSQH